MHSDRHTAASEAMHWLVINLLGSCFPSSAALLHLFSCPGLDSGKEEPSQHRMRFLKYLAVH